MKKPPVNDRKAKVSLDFKATSEIPVPKRLVDQVIGQDKSVALMKKAAAQKRNVLLIGLPGTGKSMLAQAMAEILPLQKLVDILVYANPVDPNNPKVRVVKAGEGKKIVQQARLDAKSQDDSMRLFSLLLPLLWFIGAGILFYLKWIGEITFAALLILGGFLMIAFALGTQMKARSEKTAPKLLIDNFGKKTAPFTEATGARAGSLLGDVRHDPLQCHLGFNEIFVQNGDGLEKKSFAGLWSEMFEKYGKEVIRNEKGYEAILFPENEKVFTIGLKNGKPVLSRVLSMNRQPFEGELVDLKVGNRTVSVTPEHKVFTPTESREAKALSEKDKVIRLN